MLLLAAAMLGALAPAGAHACAVCSALGSERSRKAFFDMTIFMSLLPLGMIAWGLVWLARKGRAFLAQEFVESDELPPAPAPESAQP
jgi:high-affinity Fe2+/Pb2+ permease